MDNEHDSLKSNINFISINYHLLYLFNICFDDFKLFITSFEKASTGLIHQ